MSLFWTFLLVSECIKAKTSFFEISSDSDNSPALNLRYSLSKALRNKVSEMRQEVAVPCEVEAILMINC
jgi:hypothetical protein